MSAAATKAAPGKKLVDVDRLIISRQDQKPARMMRLDR
jgi:hypothetical protein